MRATAWSPSSPLSRVRIRPDERRSGVFHRASDGTTSTTPFGCRRADVTRLSSEASQIQTALNDISQNLYGATRTGLMSRLDEVNKDLATARQSVADLQEEGRRSRYR